MSITEVIYFQRSGTRVKQPYQREASVPHTHVFVSVEVLEKLDLAKSSFGENVLFKYPADL